MTERRSEDTSPLVPRRTLSGPAGDEPEKRKPLSERVSAAIATSGQHARTAPPTSSGPSPSSNQARHEKATGTPTPRPAAPATSSGKVRKARLRLVHVDPWSVMKTAFLLSVALGIVTVVAIAVIWGVLGISGVWESINKTVVDVVGGDTAGTFDIRDYLGPSRVLGFTMIVAVVDVILITAIATLGAFLYNLSAALLGGLEVTLAEDDH